MAFGKPPDVTKLLKTTPTVEDQLWKACVRGQEFGRITWNQKYTCLIDEYITLQKDLANVGKNLKLPEPKDTKVYVETRNLQPLPNSTNHVIGWVASRSEFKLEKYGRDVPRDMPFINLYD